MIAPRYLLPSLLLAPLACQPIDPNSRSSPSNTASPSAQATASAAASTPPSSPLPSSLPSPPAAPTASSSPPSNVWRRSPGTGSRAAGGVFEVQRRNPQGFDFSLDVWNGAHLGSTQGHARRYQGSFRWISEPDLGPCELTFRETGSSWTIEEHGNCPHGMGTSFDGTYVKQLPGPKPSFNCASATKPDETLICKDEVLASLDREMDRVHATLRRDPNEAGSQASQRAWLTKRSTCAPKPPTTKAEEESAIVCLARSYLARLDELDQASGHKSVSRFQRLRERVAKGEHIGLADVPRAAGALRTLLGTRYETLIDIFGNATFHEDGGYLIATGAPAGLFTIMEGWVAIGTSDDVWIGILDVEEKADGSLPSRLELHVPQAQRDRPAPASFDAWRARFSSVPVRRVVATW